MMLWAKRLHKLSAILRLKSVCLGQYRRVRLSKTSIVNNPNKISAILLFASIDVGIKVHSFQSISDHPRWSFLYKRRATTSSTDRHRLVSEVLLLISSQVRLIFRLWLQRKVSALNKLGLLREVWCNTGEVLSKLSNYRPTCTTEVIIHSLRL